MTAVHELFYSTLDNGLSVGIANLNPVTADLAANQAKMVAALEKFSDQKVNLVVFPEYCISGFFWEPESSCRPFMDTACYAHLAPWLEGLRKRFITETLTHIVVNCLVRTKETTRFYNACLVLDKSGSFPDPHRTYLKTFLPGMEKTYLASGVKDSLVMDSPHGRLGFLTCYDISFPQLISELVDIHGVEILVATAAWRRQGERSYPMLGIHTTDHYQVVWEKLLSIIAFQHQIWVVAANAVGPHSLEGLDFCGRSGIWAPSGIKLISGSDLQEELLVLHNITVKETISQERVAYSHGEDFRLIYRVVEGLNTTTRVPREK